VNTDILEVRFISAAGLIAGLQSTEGEQPRAALDQHCSQTATNYCSHTKRTDKDHQLGQKVFQSRYLAFKITVKKMPVGWHLHGREPYPGSPNPGRSLQFSTPPAVRT